jgi:uncharacterized membrane protein
MHPLAAAGTAALASALEFVEAATIVMAVAVTAGWRIALRATLAAIAVLVAICAILGPALVRYVPLSVLQIAIGIFLLLFGFTWLRKAIWRYGGRKAMRNEQAAFDEEVGILRSRHEDRFAFATAFNGVLLEGLEVAVIVVTFAASDVRSMVWAAGGALAAGLVVALAVAILRHPFSRVPENAMGFLVGVMLLSFGTYWSGEGLGITWPGDVALLYLAVTYAVAAFAMIGFWRSRRAAA